MYSASVLESATVICFLELQLIVAPLNMKPKPEVDFQSDQSFMLLAQSVLMKLCRVVPLGAPLGRQD